MCDNIYIYIYICSVPSRFGPEPCCARPSQPDCCKGGSQKGASKSGEGESNWFPFNESKQKGEGKKKKRKKKRRNVKKKRSRTQKVPKRERSYSTEDSPQERARASHTLRRTVDK